MSLLADLLDEGSRGMSALEVSDRIARIGGDLDVDVNHDSTVVSLTTLDRFLETGLSLVHEISTAPNLTDADFTRVRQLRLERLRQLRDHPGALADRSFAKVHLPDAPLRAARLRHQRVAGGDHGGRGADPSRADVPAGRGHAGPGRRSSGERAAGGGGGRVRRLGQRSQRSRPFRAIPAVLDPPRTPATRLGIVSRPGSAQSELRVGHVAASRATPDYHAIILLNAVLGGQFVSRLNMNLREDKGYTYGVRTGFDLRRGMGPFVLQTSVGSDVTVPALRESLRELTDIRGARPVTTDELALAQSSVALGYPRGFETVQQVARSVAQLALHELPDSYFEDFVPTLLAVTLDEVTAAAERYLDPERMAAVVVGDTEKIGDAIGDLGLGAPVAVIPPI